MRSPLIPKSVVEVIDINLLGKRWLQKFQIDISKYLPKTEKLKLLICTTTGLKFYRLVIVAGLGELCAKIQKIIGIIPLTAGSMVFVCNALLNLNVNAYSK